MAFMLTVNFCFFLFFSRIGKSTAANLVYVPNFTGLVSCDGFSNEFVDLDELSIDTDPPSDEAAGVGLSGQLKILKEIIDAYDVTLSVSKETETAKELMFSSRVNVCDSLTQEDAPWAALVEMMGISACPIETKGYAIDDFKLSLEPYGDVLNRDFCGEYSVEISIVKEMNQKSCHTLGIEIVEIDLD